ncbi:hypothetical protein C8Q74DRAFT_161803 [Fomes fomentarius]|nr:hypothetical protein C8Q74DRAFT_161803 [Fomes fomentarius]
MSHHAHSSFTQAQDQSPVDAPVVPWGGLCDSLPFPRHEISATSANAPEWHNLDASPSSSAPSPAPTDCPSPTGTPSTTATSPPSSRASSPGSPRSSPPPKHKSASRRLAKDPNHIPRPRNAFILFRSDKCRELKGLERDHRMISRIIAEMWKNGPRAQKEYYQHKAAMEKEKHDREYPGYRFAPQQRAAPPKRRKVKRNGKEDKDRCKLMAGLLLEGKTGEDLKAAVDQFDHEVQERQAREAPANTPSDDYTTVVFNANPQPTPSTPSTPQLASSPSSSGETPFRSPLLPPVTPLSGPELQFEVTELPTPSPLSPLQFSPQPHLNTSTLNVHPSLPEDPLLSQYSPMQHFGAMQPHESLGLTNMYTPKNAQYVMACNEVHNDYLMQNNSIAYYPQLPMEGIQPAYSPYPQVAPPAAMYPIELPAESQHAIIFTNPFAPGPHDMVPEFAPEQAYPQVQPQQWQQQQQQSDAGVGSNSIPPPSLEQYTMDVWPEFYHNDGMGMGALGVGAGPVQTEPSDLQGLMHCIL